MKRYCLLLVKKIVIVGLVMQYNLVQAQAEPWSWSYKTVCSDDHAQILQRTGELQLSKKDIEPFTQLIFSWNALRPPTGHFTFNIQVRDQKTRKWDVWHKMSEWGAGRQRSFMSDHGQFTKFHHVRLELLDGKVADAVRIKVQATPDADCSLLHALCISSANFNKFETERGKLFLLPSVHIKNVPRQSQMVLKHPKKEVICSPTSTSMLMGYLKKQHVSATKFAEGSFDHGLDAYGSWPFNTAHAYEVLGGAAYFRVMRLNSFEDLHAKLTERIPVVVSVRGALRGAPQSYNNGHLICVVGWDNERKKVICHDPAFASTEKTYVEYDVKTFLDGWERSRRLAYVAERS